jgi:hypothetical protein
MENNIIKMDIEQLKKDLKALNDEFYLNNFTARQDFNKYSDFTTRLKVPHYASDPATCQVGEIIEVGGKLKICSASNTWSIVGTQS